MDRNDLMAANLCERKAREHTSYAPDVFVSYLSHLASHLERAGRYNEARIERRRAHHYSLATLEMVSFLVDASEEYHRTGERYSAFSSALMARRLMDLMTPSPELEALNRRCTRVLVPTMEAMLRNPITRIRAVTEMCAEIR